MMYIGIEMSFKRNLFCIVGICLFIFLLIFIDIKSPRWETQSQIEPRVILDTSWKISVNDLYVSESTLPQKLFLTTKDKVTIERKLGMVSIITGPTLYFKTINQAVRVFSDDKQIYSCGMPILERSLGTLNGRNIHFVRIPQDSDKKNIKIEFFPLEKNGEARIIPAIYIGTKYACLIHFIKDNFIKIIMCFCVLMIFLIYLALYIFAKIRKAKTNEYVSMGFFSFVIGLLLLLETSIPQLFITNSFVLYVLFILLIPIVPLLLINTLQNSYIFKVQKKFVYLCIVLCIIDTLFYCLAVFSKIYIFYADIFNVIYFSFVFLILLVISIKKSLLIQNIDEYCFAFWILTIGIVFDVIRYFNKIEHYDLIIFTPICLLIFFIIRGISVVYKYFISVEQIIKTQTLEEMAFTDILTGLKNRTAFEEKQKEIITQENEKKVKYKCGLIIFDLNGLKEINDKYGHQAGDILLRNFSECLRSVFPIQKIYRLGGDEFCVLYENITEKAIENKILRLKIYTDNKGISVAHGWGTFNEKIDKTFADFFKRIDMKMYSFKQIQKQKPLEVRD